MTASVAIRGALRALATLAIGAALALTLAARCSVDVPIGVDPHADGGHVDMDTDANDAGP